MADVYISLGSNLGEREGNLAAAQARLAHEGWVRIVHCSSLYETEPWGPVPQGWYLNQVCHGETALPPRALMFWLLAVEQLGGRDRPTEARWGPRLIDIDLLAFGSEIYQDPVVDVPHPRLHLRRFVLLPWVEIAPGWRHPQLGLSVVEMLEQVEDAGVVRPFKAPSPPRTSNS